MCKKLNYTQSQDWKSCVKHSKDLFGKSVVCLTFLKRLHACVLADDYSRVYEWSDKEHARARVDGY